MPTEPSPSFVRRVLTVLALVTAVVVACLLVWQTATALLTLFAGLLVGVLLRGLTLWTSARTGLSNGWALAVVSLALLLFAAGGFTILAASVTAQFSDLYDQLPRAIEQLRSRIETNPLGQRVLGAIGGGDGAGDGGELTASPAQMATAASATFGILGNFVLVLFIGLFLAADPRVYRRGLVRLLPRPRRARAEVVIDDTTEVLLRWLSGRLIEMTIIGVVTWIGLMLMGVPLALALGIIAGALSFIPNIGPIISAVPAMLIAGVENPMMAVYVGAFYLALQTVESYLLEPYIVRKTADLPAAAVVGFQLFLGTLLGIVGLTLATPLLAMITVLVEKLYIEDVLGDTAA